MVSIYIVCEISKRFHVATAALQVAATTMTAVTTIATVSASTTATTI
jgi:hypothetical protein